MAKLSKGYDSRMAGTRTWTKEVGWCIVHVGMQGATLTGAKWLRGAGTLRTRRDRAPEGGTGRRRAAGSRVATGGAPDDRQRRQGGKGRERGREGRRNSARAAASWHGVTRRGSAQLHRVERRSPPTAVTTIPGPTGTPRDALPVGQTEVSQPACANRGSLQVVSHPTATPYVITR